ncbi:MAG TPA: hypothetical protein VHV83_08635 [Armatimonadota bacterium]|nr:hypothetical protein [Armatimonadota bacterium]
MERFVRFSTLALLICSVFTLVMAQGIPGLNQAQLANMGAKLLEAPEYPDEQEITIKYARFTYELNMSGSASCRNDDALLTHTLNAHASEIITLQNRTVTRKASVNGLLRIVAINPEGKGTFTSTFSHNNQDAEALSDDDAPRYCGTTCVSKKQGLIYFEIPGGAGQNWTLSGFDVHTNAVISSKEGTVSQTLPVSQGSVNVRLPNYGGGSSPFSQAAKKAEATGRDGDLLLTMNGMLEAPWQQGGSHGSFTVPVEAVCGPDGFIVDTTQVWQARSAIGAKPKILIPGTLTVRWVIGTKPPESEMTIAPLNPNAYDEWLPLPDSSVGFSKLFGNPQPMTVLVKINPKEKGGAQQKGRIDFYLEDVSAHNGRCCNFPRDNKQKDDLRFSDMQEDGIVLDPDNRMHAYTKERVTAAGINVIATDTAASGKVVARCDELNLVADYQNSGIEYLALPKDDNHNDVADAWENTQGVMKDNLPISWDEEEVNGQEAKGDGLSLFREYRGFVVDDGGGQRFTRLSPKRKELFVIDNGGVFRTDLWEKASQIRAYKLTDDLVYGGNDRTTSRIVDYTIGALSGQHKYAVRIEVIHGLVEKDAPQGANPTALGYCGFDEGYDPGAFLTPKDARYCRVFPDRIREQLIKPAYERLGHALRDPNSDDGQTLAKMGLPTWLAQKAYDQLSEANRETLVQQMVLIDAVHEMGHACGLAGHTITNANGDQSESSQGAKNCPMRYPDRIDNFNLTILTSIFRLGDGLPLQYDSFCRDGEYRCFSHLNVKD